MAGKKNLENEKIVCEEKKEGETFHRCSNINGKFICGEYSEESGPKMCLPEN